MARGTFTILLVFAACARLSGTELPIEVRTESLHVLLDPRGAVPASWQIVDARYTGGGDPDPGGGRAIELIVETQADGPGMFDVIIPGAPEETRFFQESLYTATTTNDGTGTLVEFRSPVSPGGSRMTRIYRFSRTGFETGMRLRWESDPTALAAESGRRAPLVVVGPGLGPSMRRDPGIAGSLYAYVEAVEGTRDGVNSHSPDEENPEIALGGGSSGIAWAGVHNRYFLMALLPGAPDRTGFSMGRASLVSAPSAEAGGIPDVIVEIALDSADKDGAGEDELRIYSGPKVRSELEAVDPSLDALLFARVWDWIRWLCFGLLYLLRGIHEVVPSWGLSIILLAVVIRVVMYPVAGSGLRAQARFNAANARMQPELQRIKEQFKGDAARQHHETMRVYKEHGVSMFSPFKGCLWILIQLPIFIALFNVIGQAYELRGAEFLWIGDLAAPDRLFELGFSIPFLGSAFNLLPMIMAATQVLTTNLAPAHGADPSQQRSQRLSMWAMAAVFFVLFYNFPAGLVLYWTTANLGHLLQQRMMSAEPTGPRREANRS